MKLTQVKIYFQAFTITDTLVVAKSKDYTIDKAEKFIHKYFGTKTAIVYSIEIEGEIIENPMVKSFQIVGKESEKYLKKK